MPDLSDIQTLIELLQAFDKLTSHRAHSFDRSRSLHVMEAMRNN